MRRRKRSKKQTRREKLQFYPTEVFKEISLGADSEKLKLFYAISNFGRLVSFRNEIDEGRFVNGSKQDGYRLWHYTIRGGNNKLKYKHCFYYRLVAEYFITKTSDEQVYVLHLDRDRANDHVDNLRWATKAEMIAHSKKSPFVLAAREKQLANRRAGLQKKVKGNKLTKRQVIFLKKKLLDPDRKILLKTLAKKYGVTTMTLQRIKTGENWGNINVEMKKESPEK
jgi:hypothetical protein